MAPFQHVRLATFHGLGTSPPAVKRGSVSRLTSQAMTVQPRK